MMKFRENEDAVSPVIGVILMVAITVILAAVIAAFVFGMAGNIQTTKNVAATATQQGNDIIVTYQGGADSNSVAYLRIDVSRNAPMYYYWRGETGGTLTSTAGVPDESEWVAGKIPVGSYWTFTGTAERDHVVVAAHFSDGSDQVVLDTFV
ncbi:type IV pilin N-terminal domain-containing protein [Methanoculleus receptaculi]|uniref:Type IV pilin N-terminal domain-containing protein n=1 Tax=Methanoculleus receptaculi TaxID=394967 RepID=A0AAX4FTV0_9EURY|nr:type IV pilin N-terminal domain-containing protein [Methanoculleus receptaculi]WOX57182.1 type IV pilin N-terminal domain-containing protein [Methanoculleus receptaculi]